MKARGMLANWKENNREMAQRKKEDGRRRRNKLYELYI
jgi:hypothetical protein